MGRGLEPAGVNLEARGFKQYIQNLTEIERKQKEVFDREFKGTARSFAQVQSAARNYERQLKSLESQYNRAVAQEQKLHAAQSKTTSGVNSLGSALGGLALAAFSKQTAQFIVDSAQLAASFDAQRVGLNNLAATYGTAGPEIRNAIREAAKGTLSETKILLAANTALQLDVARTPDEFARVTQNALVLGKTLGLDATESIERFTVALGRKSLQRLDDFGIKTEQVNAQIAKLAQEQLGKAFGDLTTAEHDLLFVEAALRVADERVQAIGTDAIEAAGGFDRLSAQAENLKLAFGEAVLPTTSSFVELLSNAAVAAQQALAFISAGAAGLGVILDKLGITVNVFERLQQLGRGEIGLGEALSGIDLSETIEGIKNFDQILDEAAQAAVDRFKDVARATGATFPEDQVKASTDDIKDNTDALEDNEDQIKALQAAIRQAEQLELSFARAAEDAARKQARQVAKLNRDQSKERQKFLNDQVKEFDDFNKDQAEAAAEAEKDLAKEREKANKERVREQDKLFRELKQAQERYDLDRIQSQRRFNLDETRLRAEGDILGLQRLREDFNLEQQEQAENFDLQQRQRKEDAKDQEQQQDEQRQERVQAAEQELKDLQNSFAEKQAEFLKQQDEEFQALLQSQAEQREALQESFREQEEDRLISQARQLEDLGRSLLQQKDITEEGALAIAQEIEKVFGEEGVADKIMIGYTDRVTKQFEDLFDSIEETVKETEKAIKETELDAKEFGAGVSGLNLGPTNPATFGIPAFQHGGSFEVGGTGGADSQLVAFRATPGERVTVTPESQTFKMPIAAPSQLNVSFGGRSQIDITGLEGASQATIDAAVEQMIEVQDIAIRRILRRHGVN